MSSGLAANKLFSPLKIGRYTLKHRVVLAPLTRVRSPEHIPDQKVVDYYAQRASDGGLLISEATHISVMSGNYDNVPGVYTPEQIRAWKKVTDAVHDKGGVIFCQLWHVGRTTAPSCLGGRTPLGPSSNRVEEGMVYFTRGGPVPYVQAQEMTEQDINDTIEDYIHAAKTAIAAGFDGVEVHSANGYLLDQFICDNINKRTDKYGGSVENRARLMLEVVDAVVAAIGADKVGIRFSPFGFFQGTGTSDILGHYGYAIGEVEKRGLAYIHLVEPRSDLLNNDDAKLQKLKEIAKAQGKNEEDLLSLKPFREIAKTTPMISCGSFDASNAAPPVEEGITDAVAFGRYFISNPDLPERLAKGYPLAGYNRDTFYAHGREGYTDYPTYDGAKL
ncbi:hypothetical protein FN846DRAFT_781932 [Sphaerosporella brunnea]|uniref:NADH:flavin oxidoreductase/NADH oxidase N-terminal domain-containing protein n=1 Tax=Sphaerosporella brunnea TaxID=1250544 RepID=A0A5J5EQR4_9PEZI|nr:hypothetical protein FN846DRAFT_781932 [Sphaerosporella brunnea]